jgi:membrane protease subunit HflK
VRRFVLGVADPELALQSIAEAVVRGVIGRRPLVAILSDGRDEVQRAATSELRDRIRPLDLGLVVHGVTFQDVHPPLAVVDAYRDVSRAESDRQRRINEAGAYRDETLAEAGGKAKAVVNAAEAKREGLVARAAASADAFLYQQSAREPAPALTDFRMFWEAVAGAFAGKPKMILDSIAERPRRLILTKLPMERAVPALVREPKGSR